jgi:hypothetical protein
MENPDNSEMLAKIWAKLEDLDRKVSALTAEAKLQYEDAIATAGCRGDLPRRTKVAP